jgi:DNA-binding YbaB/EbfC family protein
MGQTMDQMKMLNELRKAQKSLKNEIVEVEAGDGAVVIQITGELKIKKVELDPEKIDLDDIHELERWIENAMRDGYAKAQEIATDKMKPFMGALGGGFGL